MNLKPILYFLISGIVFLIAAIFSGNISLDIQLHDTYFVIAYSYLFTAAGLLLLFKSLVYFGLQKAELQVSASISYWHLGLFLVGVAGTLITLQLSVQLQWKSPESFLLHVLLGFQILCLISFISSFGIFIWAIIKSLFYK